MAFLSVLFLFSCADMEKQELCARVDKIDSSLKEYHYALSVPLFEDNEVVMAQGDQLIAELKMLESDTIPLELAREINRFMQLHEMFPAALEMNQLLLKDITEIKLDLNHLRTDIKSGNGKRHKYDAYIAKEEEKLNVISERFERCIELREEVKKDFLNAMEQVENVISERIGPMEVQ